MYVCFGELIIACCTMVHVSEELVSDVHGKQMTSRVSLPLRGITNGVCTKLEVVFFYSFTWFSFAYIEMTDLGLLIWLCLVDAWFSL